MTTPARGEAPPHPDAAPAPVRRARLALVLVTAGLLAVAAGLAALRPPWGFETGPFFPAPDARGFRATVWIALFWASLANAAVAALGAATAHRWARPLPPARPWAPPPRLRPALAVLLALAALLALGLRAPLASGSLWWDEIWSLTRVIRGPLEPDPQDPARLELEDRSWARTLWYYRKPTNHVLYNVAARAALDAWRDVRGAPPAAFDERVFRAPALAAAALAVVALGLLGWRAGFPRAGVAAAFLLAIHPWHLRYGVEGRAYSLLVLFTVVACLGLMEALRTGRPRGFALAGAGIVGLLWTHPFSAYFVGILAVAGLAGALRAPVGRERRRGLAWRWLATNALAGMVFVQAMAPNLAQAMTWPNVWEEDRQALRQAVDWWGETATGIPVRCAADDRPEDPYPCVMGMAEDAAWPVAVVWVVLPLLFALGL
ncbi:MAG: glycosyltransferase family 39 protein, partial [Myxococcota bacterium]|nr:glycosyltransferase family 39 protein [Myxococcota bacterium]